MSFYLIFFEQFNKAFFGIVIYFLIIDFIWFTYHSNYHFPITYSSIFPKNQAYILSTITCVKEMEQKNCSFYTIKLILCSVKFICAFSLHKTICYTQLKNIRYFTQISLKLNQFYMKSIRIEIYQNTLIIFMKDIFISLLN